jgi:hypothetical protein
MYILETMKREGYSITTRGTSTTKARVSEFGTEGGGGAAA